MEKTASCWPARMATQMLWNTKDYFKHLLNGIHLIENKTGFYWACANGHVKVVEALLNERSGRINYNVVGREGLSGYLVAFEKGHTDLVKLFLETSVFKFKFKEKENVESVKPRQHSSWHAKMVTKVGINNCLSRETLHTSFSFAFITLHFRCC